MSNSDEEIENLEMLLLAAEELEKEEKEAPKKKEERSVYAPKFIDILKNAQQTSDTNVINDGAGSSNNGKSSTNGKSVVHNGDTDSSDDEDVRNFLEQKYNQYGRDVKLKLKQDEDESKYFSFGKEKRISLCSTALSSPVTTSAPLPLPKPTVSKPKNTAVPSNPLVNPNVFCDPIFGIRIIHPLVSSVGLIDRMQGKTPVSLARVRLHTEKGDIKNDWVVAGVIASKSPPKTSQKGDLYSIWTVTDLKGEIKTLTLFLFKNAHKDLWKTAVGMVVGILNPSILDRKDDKVQAVLSIHNPNSVMLLGQSKDLGTCKSLTKSGQKCTAIVNLSECDVCVYHMKQEYTKTSRRSEFGSASLGRGLNELRNKVLGNSEVFYGGQSFTAIKAPKNVKQIKKDRERLTTLSEAYQSPFSYEERAGDLGSSLRAQRMMEAVTKTKKIGIAASLDISVAQRKRDLERLKALQGNEKDSGEINCQASTSGISGNLSSSLQKSNLSKFSAALQSTKSPGINKPKLSMSQPTPESSKTKQFSFIPKLSSGNLSFDLDLKTTRKNEFAKQKALEVLKKKPVEKTDPNFFKHRGTDQGKKRALEELNNSSTNDEESNGTQEAKKQKISEEEEKVMKRERILQIMNTKSSHTDLVEEHQLSEQEKYFKNLERKENMEEKMLKTTQLECKAVVCLKCKYIAFSAADRCKEEGHELRVKDAVKRFYKCLDCSNRTVTLYRIPKTSCKNCQSSRWERTGMMREKAASVGEKLSIRGDEEMFVGTATELASINLLVPEDN